MNKKAFTVAVIFLCATLGWFGVTIYWLLTVPSCVNTIDLVVAVLFVLAGIGMVYNEFNKKKRRHLDEVDKYKIP